MGLYKYEELPDHVTEVDIVIVGGKPGRRGMFCYDRPIR